MSKQYTYKHELLPRDANHLKIMDVIESLGHEGYKLLQMLDYTHYAKLAPSELLFKEECKLLIFIKEIELDV